MRAMRKVVFYFFVAAICLASACSERPQIPEAFVGSWQSDEALTLESLSHSNSVTPEDMKLFSDDFFGDRVIVFGTHEGMAYFIGQEWADIEQSPEWYPYDIASSGSDFVTLRHPTTEYTEAGETTWRLDGDFIYADLTRLEFREYYRRVDD